MRPENRDLWAPTMGERDWTLTFVADETDKGNFQVDCTLFLEKKYTYLFMSNRSKINQLCNKCLNKFISLVKICPIIFKNMPELMAWYVMFRLRFLVNLNETSPGIAANVGDPTR